MPTNDDLRPYVVNLSQGRFTSSGDYATTEADVDAIFDQHLPAFVAARGGVGPVPLVLWAHGGLVDEGGGLQIARNQRDWWLANGAYPLHFVWESGLLETLGARTRTRGFDLTEISDWTIEQTLSGAGSLAWGGMKNSAREASGPDGGATYVAQRLADHCRDHSGQIEVHAVGHSAGSIFHSYFLPMAVGLGVPPIESLQLLAPAIRVDHFLATLLPMVTDRLKRLTVFTMRAPLELDDTCLGIYRKSLLYLVSRAFEPEDDAAILGLEDFLGSDPRLADLAASVGTTQTVWSVTQESTGGPRGASTSRSHGGFDNDGPTMDSVARRILGRDDIVRFPASAQERGAVVWAGAQPRPADPAIPPTPATDAPRMRALCVGIDAYAGDNRLHGCVNDATAWADAFRRRGFTTELLTDGQATREGILGRLAELVGSSRAGDVIAFQFAGHGVEVQDTDGDEGGDTNGRQDEAFCPVDTHTGTLILDDEIFAILRGLPDGVVFSSFFDCCHSASMSRSTRRDGAPAGATGLPPGLTGIDLKARLLVRSPELVAAHAATAAGIRARLGPSRGPAGMKDLCFAACQESEVALESDGHGHFTTCAVPLLDASVTDLTNEGFLARVVDQLGTHRRQTPDLDCRPDRRKLPFLSADGGDRAGAPAAPAASPGAEPPTGRAAAAALMRAAADVLEAER